MSFIKIFWRQPVRFFSQGWRAEIAEARKRCVCKRFLAKFGLSFNAKDQTEHLVRRVRTIVYLLRNRPFDLPKVLVEMTGEQVEQAAKSHHYVKNLLALKVCFGLHSSMGCVVGPGCKTINCRTIADLVRLKWCSDEYLYLDAHWHNLVPIKYRTTPA